MENATNLDVPNSQGILVNGGFEKVGTLTPEPKVIEATTTTNLV